MQRSAAMFDRDMRYLAASPSWHAMNGLPQASLVGRSHYEVIPEIPDRWRELYRRGLAGESLGSDLDLFARERGEVQWLSWRLRPWLAAGGSVGGILIESEDLAEARAAEAEARLMRAERDAIFGTSALGIAIVDWGGTVLRANRVLEASLGVAEGALEGTKVSHLALADDRTALTEALDALHGGDHGPLRGGFRGAGAGMRHFEFTTAWLAAGGGVPVKFVFFVADIGERMGLEAQLRSADRLAAIGMFGAGVGHDMHNVLLPMSAHVNTFAAALERLGGPAECGDSLRAIRGGIGYLRSLADGMHYLAGDGDTDGRVEASVTPLGPWWTAMEPLLSSMVPAGTRLEARIEPLRAGIRATALTQAALNLVVNACEAVRQRHGPRAEGGFVRVTATGAGNGPRGSVELAVADNGVGMDAGTLRRACEPFFTTKPLGRGTGLGLSIVQRVAEQAGGTMAIESTRGEGTCVRIVVPAADA